MKQVQRIIVTLCLMAVCISSFSQGFNKNHIKVTTAESKHKGTIRVLKVVNNFKDSVDVKLRNETDNSKDYDFCLASGQPWQWDITCTIVFAKPKKEKNYITIVRYNSPKANEKRPAQNDKATTSGNIPAQSDTLNKKQPVQKDKTSLPVKNPAKSDSIRIEKVITDFIATIDTLPLFSQQSIEDDSIVIMNHIENLRNWSDKVDYIESKGLQTYIDNVKDTINLYREKDSLLICCFLERYKGKPIVEKEACVDSMKAILTARLNQREANLYLLEEELMSEPLSIEINWKLIGVSAAAILLLIFLFLWYRQANKKFAKPTQKDFSSASSDAGSLIIVGPRTTPTLKKQTLEDVYENDAYMKIDCNDFCHDSSVRFMYIKNSCIKDIYNRYAEDLRNPNNPKEDGCMVLGRWVFDESSSKYDVSLEYTVMPGDDAIFAEYELNFGGKIQLAKNEMLKRLRRDTDMQYDLTCWVHSHPGLGVFFSNSDNNVQMQLKHPAHPSFLTAIVVDILTPNLELGIFTFKTDATINSKNDLTTMYSLDTMYQWALDSERKSFNKDDYFNTLSKAEQRVNECFGIELSNGSVIDMTYLISNPAGFLGYIHGYPVQKDDKIEYICSTVTKSEASADTEMIGCFVVASHCSIPTIRKTIGSLLDRISFVMVYTITDESITSIPVKNGDLCDDEQYYGEQSLEELKIWTRRRR